MTAFALQVVLSAAIGGGWIAATTVLAERYGTSLGGVLAGIPSTIAVSLLFIALTQHAASAVEATTGVPLFVAAYGPLVTIYVLLSTRCSETMAFGVGIAVWFGAVAAVIALGYQDFATGLVAELVVLGVSWLALGAQQPRSTPRSAPAAGRATIVVRAASSGLVIAAAVVLARIGGSIVGGAASSFPAVLLSSTVITRHTRGIEFSNALVRVIMVSAGVNIAAYAAVIRFTYTRIGVVPGTVCAFAASLVTASVLIAGTRLVTSSTTTARTRAS
jgi:hypothetical protein